MRKTLILSGLILLAFITLPSSIILAINAYDPPLRPEVSKILEKTRNQPHTDRQKQAYFYVLGVYAGEKNDPEKKGAQLWEQRDRSGFWKGLAKSRPWQNDFGGCGPDVCSVESLEAHPEYAAVLSKYHDIIQHYIHLMQYEEGATLYYGDRNSPIVSVVGLPFTMHRLFLLQLAQWIRQGGSGRVLDLLTSSNRYLHSYFNEGTLLERMVAVVNMKANAAFVMEEVKRDPKLHVPQEFLDTLVPPDVDDLLFGAAERELAVFDNILHSHLFLGDLELSALGEKVERFRLKDHIPMRALLRPNETENKFYEITWQAMTSDCPSYEVEDCVPSAKWTHFDRPLDYIVNPVGRALVRIMAVQAPRRRLVLQKRVKEILDLKTELERHT